MNRLIALPNPEIDFKSVAAANFTRESEALLNRKGTIVYRKEWTIVLFPNTGGLASTR
jgi:hypothetical protein